VCVVRLFYTVFVSPPVLSRRLTVTANKDEPPPVGVGRRLPALPLSSLKGLGSSPFPSPGELSTHGFFLDRRTVCPVLPRSQFFLSLTF